MYTRRPVFYYSNRVYTAYSTSIWSLSSMFDFNKARQSADCHRPHYLISSITRWLPLYLIESNIVKISTLANEFASWILSVLFRLCYTAPSSTVSYIRLLTLAVGEPRIELLRVSSPIDKMLAKRKRQFRSFGWALYHIYTKNKKRVIWWCEGRCWETL